jgi:hypothetical protein
MLGGDELFRVGINVEVANHAQDPSVPYATSGRTHISGVSTFSITPTGGQTLVLSTKYPRCMFSAELPLISWKSPAIETRIHENRMNLDIN